MSLTLNTDLLPDQPMVEKATWHHFSRVFGTLYTKPRTKYDFASARFEHAYPEVLDVLMDEQRKDTLLIPSEWKVSSTWHSTEWHEADFVSFWLSVPHEIDFSQQRSAESTLLLLSGHLQTGEAFNFRNFNNYETGNGLKFLPFVVTPNEFRFYVFNPTRPRVSTAVAYFDEALRRVQGLLPVLSDTVRDVYAAVRLDEIGEIENMAYEVGSLVDSRLREALKAYSNQFGFVYSDMRGSQSTKRFSYEMHRKTR